MEQQIEKLANYILQEYPSWPGSGGDSEGAVDCVIRILKFFKSELLIQVNLDLPKELYAAKLSNLIRKGGELPPNTL